METKEFKIGDIVEVSGGYFKVSNGLFIIEKIRPHFVENMRTGERVFDHNLYYLQGICKNGKIRNRAEYFPLCNTISDYFRSMEAKNWNKKNARMSLATVKDMSYLIDHYKNKLEESKTILKDDSSRRLTTYYAEQLKEDVNRYSDIITVLGGKLSEEKKEKPLTIDSVKIYYNGLKVNDQPMYSYYPMIRNLGTKDEFIQLSAVKYVSRTLPRFLFEPEVEQLDFLKRTSYTDNSSEEPVSPDHPFYPFFRRAVAQMRIREMQRYGIKLSDKELETFRAILKEPAVHPTKADIQNLLKWKATKRKEILAARREKERKELKTEEKARKKEFTETSNILENSLLKYPLKSGEPFVVIHWSEASCLNYHPQKKYSECYHWNDKVELEMSLQAANEALGELDKYYAKKNAGCGYEKTSFVVHVPGEEDYEGRYDLGDDEKSLIQHILSFSEYHGITKNVEYARKLEGFCLCGAN